MLLYAMIFWIGKQLNAPSWFWWCWSFGVALKFISFSFNIIKAGAKL